MLIIAIAFFALSNLDKVSVLKTIHCTHGCFFERMQFLLTCVGVSCTDYELNHVNWLFFAVFFELESNLVVALVNKEKAVVVSIENCLLEN